MRRSRVGVDPIVGRRRATNRGGITRPSTPVLANGGSTSRAATARRKCARRTAAHQLQVHLGCSLRACQTRSSMTLRIETSLQHRSRPPQSTTPASPTTARATTQVSRPASTPVSTSRTLHQRRRCDPPCPAYGHWLASSRDGSPTVTYQPPQTRSRSRGPHGQVVGAIDTTTTAVGLNLRRCRFIALLRRRRQHPGGASSTAACEPRCRPATRPPARHGLSAAPAVGTDLAVAVAVAVARRGRRRQERRRWRHWTRSRCRGAWRARGTTSHGRSGGTSALR